MKSGFLGRFLGTATAVCCLAAALSGCGSSDSSSVTADSTAGNTSTAGKDNSSVETDSAAGKEGTVLTEVTQGIEDGYNYELWKDSGDTTMTLGPGGAFSCEWSNINNALFRRGIKFSDSKPYQEHGDITFDYGVDYQPDGNSYLCVYGWTKSPLIEYYIVESWGNWRPPGSNDVLGTVTVDGATYDIYKTTRYEQPSIEGTTTFDQYWSVRQSKPTPVEGNKIEGTISVTKHFQAWESVGLEMGGMYEAALNIEGYQSKGKADVYKNVLTIADSYTPDPGLDVSTFEETELISNDFESDLGSWEARGEGVSVKQSKNKFSDGTASLFAYGRKDNWQGAAIQLDKDTFKPGQNYGFSVDVMQDSGESCEFKLTLQCDIAGSTSYPMVATASAESGKWVTLKNGSYQIPSGAENMILYVESPDSLTDFYIDSFSATGRGGSKPAAQEGTKPAVTGGDPVEVKSAVDISWIDPDKPMVAISFDDGASATTKGDPAYRIIDAVANAGFHATFFYVGNWIKTEEQVQYAYEKGMEIANHTMTHPYLSKCTEEEIRSEFDKAHEKLKGIIGAEPSKVMRLPYLDVNDKVKKTLNDVALISCSVDTKDWDKATTEQIVDKIKTAKENGSLENAIVLCHENYATTAEAMEQLMPWLKDEGWQVVTVSELFAVKGKTMMGGTVYTKVS
ncbi:MAG: glycoside hydrolase family 11 protein [Ruminococcus sp.]|nr:glycoside hydrolase family 11 protein [Ruminococcus sp.]